MAPVSPAARVLESSALVTSGTRSQSLRPSSVARATASGLE